MLQRLQMRGSLTATQASHCDFQGAAAPKASMPFLVLVHARDRCHSSACIVIVFRRLSC